MLYDAYVCITTVRRATTSEEISGDNQTSVISPRILFARILEPTLTMPDTLESLDMEEREGKKDDQGDEDHNGDRKRPSGDGDAEMKDADAEQKEDEDAKKDAQEDLVDLEVLNSSTRDIVSRRRLIENETRIMRGEFNRLNHEKTMMHEKIKDNVEKIDNNR